MFTTAMSISYPACLALVEAYKQAAEAVATDIFIVAKTINLVALEDSTDDILTQAHRVRHRQL